MRASVAAAWPAMCRRYEGVTTWLYLDTKGKVTTGVGFLVDSVAAAQALPWLDADTGRPATPAAVAAEWHRVKALTKWQHLNGLNDVWRDSADLRLELATVDRLLDTMTPRYWSGPVKAAPNLEDAPADAQLAILDLSWQNGSFFLNDWTDTRAAVRAGDWSGVADIIATFLPAKADRTARRKRLFRNAAAVVRLGLDRERLWDTQTPTGPPVPAPPPVVVEPVPVDPQPTPPEVPPVPAVTWKHSSKWGADYRSWRGGNMTPTGIAVCEAIPLPITITQGGLSTGVAASANTHAGLGAYDVNVKGDSKATVLEKSAQLIRSGEYAFPRGGWFGTAIFATHIHVASRNDRASLHPEARAQVADFEHKPRRNGLAGHGRYVGPYAPAGDTWSTSPYNPKNIKAPDAPSYRVVVGELVGTDVDRRPTKARKRGFVIDAARLVRRWGRWNVVTTAGNFYAVADSKQTYLEPVPVPVPAPPAPEPPQENTP